MIVEPGLEKRRDTLDKRQLPREESDPQQVYLACKEPVLCHLGNKFRRTPVSLQTFLLRPDTSIYRLQSVRPCSERLLELVMAP